MAATDLVWVDMLLLGALLLSIVVGLWRGLVFELMSLVGWVVAYIAAQAFSVQVGAYLPIGTAGSALHQGLAFALTFIAALVAWAVLAKLVRMAIHATPLTLADRFLGAGFGLLRGVIVLLVVATVVAFTPAARSPAWTASQGASWLGVMIAGIKPILPADIARHLPT